MDVKDVSNREHLDSFVGSQERAQFLQSWQWGEFQKELGRNVIRIGVFDGDILLASAQIIEQRLPLGKSYWYCPRGPVVDVALPVEKHTEAWKVLVSEIVGRAKKAKALFLKIEPPIYKQEHQLLDTFVGDHAIAPAPFVQPQDTWHLNLKKTTDELQGAMHHKTRYNIKLAERKGVTVRIGTKEADFKKFWQLNTATTQRDNFQAHPKSYYQQMFKTLIADGLMKLYIAEHNGIVLVANYVASFGDTVTYVHGASSNEQRNLMAPHLLQWKQITDAKDGGFSLYDFGGVAPENATKHKWEGITRFKKGFGGESVSFVGVYDLPLQMVWYKLYRMAHRIRN